MAASHNESVDYSNVTLDLYEIKNIGHPLWEFYDVHPDIIHLFNKFNDLFFNGILANRVDIEWMADLVGGSAGETYPADRLRNNRISLRLNKNLLERCLRKDLIEIFLHEMIHAYLLETNTEGVSSHGKSFRDKMKEINHRTGLNLTVEHALFNEIDEKRGTVYKIWRCRGTCRSLAPYFGFLWKNNVRKPTSKDKMWNAACNHSFEMYGDNPKKAVTKWECITMFSDFLLENNIRTIPKLNRGIGNRHVSDDSFNSGIDMSCIWEELGTELETVPTQSLIPNKLYVNFNAETNRFVSFDQFMPNAGNVEELRTICMICLDTIAEEDVIQHLKACSGLDFSLITSEELPILRKVQQVE